MNGFLLLILLVFVVYCIYAFLTSEIIESNIVDQKEKGRQGHLVAIDVRGKSVSLTTPAQRMVVLYQGALDGIYMLGAEKSLVGIQHNIYTNPEAFEYFSKLDPRIANREIKAPGNWENSTNLESVISLKPDLVIIASGQSGAIELLESFGIPVFVVSPKTNEELFNELLGIGILTGTENRAKELIEYTRTNLHEIRKNTSQINGSKKVYYAWSGGRIYTTSGRNSRMQECFDLAGVENACPFEIDTPNINPENLLAWDPDIILLWNSTPESLYKTEELRIMRAVKEQRVHVFEPAFFYDPQTLKIMYMALELYEVAYGDRNTEELINYRMEIMKGLYGDKAEQLFQ